MRDEIPEEARVVILKMIRTLESVGIDTRGLEGFRERETVLKMAEKLLRRGKPEPKGRGDSGGQGGNG